MNDFGPKFAASYASEVITVNYLMEQLNNIKDARNSNQNVSVDLQVVSGYNVDGIISIYRNVQNVVARLEGNRAEAVLLNCHFDSVVGSPGASDDIANCCVMMEILRILSRQQYRTQNSIVFLFNGAEEIGEF